MKLCFLCKFALLLALGSPEIVSEKGTVGLFSKWIDNKFNFTYKLCKLKI